jgi:hypothetical protein
MQIENVSDSTSAIILAERNTTKCMCPKCIAYRNQRNQPVVMLNDLPTEYSKW